jgi:ankyrin repeat protein
VKDVFDYDGRTPLHLAGAEGALATTEWLLLQGVAVNAVDRFGHTPLMDALLAERTAVAQALIEVGYDHSVLIRDVNAWGGLQRNLDFTIIVFSIPGSLST